MRKPPSEPHFLSNQYSESSDPEIGKNRRIVPNIRKK